METPHDFELQMRCLPGQTGYLVDVEATTGPATAFSSLKISHPDFIELYGNVLAAAADYDSREKFGRRLFKEVFVEAVRDRWVDCRARAEAAGRRLRLRLRIEDPELAVLPWELLYDDDFLSASGDVYVSRYFPVSEPRPSVLNGKAKVLVIVESPPDQPVQDELLDRLKTSLGGLDERFATPVVLDNPDIAGINTEMLKGYEVVHYVGHGKKDAVQMAASGDWVVKDAREFAALFTGNASVRLVLMNVCGGGPTTTFGLISGLGPLLAARRIPAVIAMQYNTVLQATAADFNHSFYAALAQSCPVDACVNSARRALRAQNQSTRDWSTPVLYMCARTGRVLDFVKGEEDAARRMVEVELERAGKLAGKYTALLSALGDLAAAARRIEAVLAVERNVRSLRVLIGMVETAKRLQWPPDQVSSAVQEWETARDSTLQNIEGALAGQADGLAWWPVLKTEFPSIILNLRQSNFGLVTAALQKVATAVTQCEAWSQRVAQEGLQAIREDAQSTVAKMSPF
jgi:hypothetical protein